jgi:hypothetical protein
MTNTRVAGAVFAAGSLAALLLASSAFSAAVAPPASAPSARPAPVAATRASTPTTVTAVAETSTDCPRARRKLWVEGEGWIVRKVPICQ